MWNFKKHLFSSTEDDNCSDILIGERTWTTCNLNVTMYRNGDPITEVTDPSEWGSATYGAWCHVDGDPDNDAIYGKLYNWWAVNDARGLAPVGYHIPTYDEYQNLKELTYLISPVGNVATKLRAISSLWTPNTGNNLSNFSALPAGIRSITGVWGGITSEADFWTASDANSYPPVTSWIYYINAPLNFDIFDDYNKNVGASVRLVKDKYWPTTLTSGYYAALGFDNWTVYGYGSKSSPISSYGGANDWGSLNGGFTDPLFNYFPVVQFFFYGETWAGPGLRYTSISLIIKGTLTEPTDWSNITITSTGGIITTLTRTTATVTTSTETDGYGNEEKFLKWKWDNVSNPFTNLLSYTVDINPAPVASSVEWLTGDYPPIAYGSSPGDIISLSGTVEIIGNPVTFRAYAFLPTGPGDGGVDTSIDIGNIDVGITSRYVDAVTPYENGTNQYSTSFTLPAGIYDWNVLCTFSNTASVGGEGGISWTQ